MVCTFKTQVQPSLQVVSLLADKHTADSLYNDLELELESGRALLPVKDIVEETEGMIETCGKSQPFHKIIFKISSKSQIDLTFKKFTGR